MACCTRGQEPMTLRLLPDCGSMTAAAAGLADERKAAALAAAPGAAPLALPVARKATALTVPPARAALAAPTKAARAAVAPVATAAEEKERTADRTRVATLYNIVDGKRELADAGADAAADADAPAAAAGFGAAPEEMATVASAENMAATAAVASAFV